MKHSDMKRKPGAVAAALLPGAAPCPLFAQAPAEALRDLSIGQLARIGVRSACNKLPHKSHVESDDAAGAHRIERRVHLGTRPRF